MKQKLIKAPQRYRELYKKIRSLPLDVNTIEFALDVTRKLFKQPAIVKNRYFYQKRHRNTIKVIDTVLIEKKYEGIHEVLDLIYKRQELFPEKLAEFLKLQLIQITPSWPERHLIDEVTKTPEVVEKYHAAVENEKEKPFKLTNHFGVKPEEVGSQESLISNETQTSIKKKLDEGVKQAYLERKQRQQEAIQYAMKAYTFLETNQGILSHLKIKPIEAIYPISSRGTPLPVVSRRKIMKETIQNVKLSLRAHFRPFQKDQLLQLRDVAISSSVPINPLFFRYAQKEIETRSKPSPRRKSKLPKSAIPTEANIRKIYRNYVMKQCYWDEKDQKFKVSDMEDFYESKHPKVPEVSIE